nr:retrovirus-related Pol polyprotein from transposon TNT 1-94 [Tanacetum cinerariifolium]
MLLPVPYPRHRAYSSESRYAFYALPLLTIVLPTINLNVTDVLEWRDMSGKLLNFLVATVWDCIRPKGDEVWNQVKIYDGLPYVSTSLNAITDHIIPMSKKKNARSSQLGITYLRLKLDFTKACTYFILKSGLVGCMTFNDNLLGLKILDEDLGYLVTSSRGGHAEKTNVITAEKISTLTCGFWVHFFNHMGKGYHVKVSMDHLNFQGEELYHKDDSWWSEDLKSKTTEDIISIGSFMEVLVLILYFVRKILLNLPDHQVNDSLVSSERNNQLFKSKKRSHSQIIECIISTVRKHAHASHKAKNVVSTTKCLELLHMDLFGPSTVRSYGGNRYTLVIVDDYSSKAYIVLNKRTKKVKESLNVTFDETPPPSKTSPLVDDDLDKEEAIKSTSSFTLTLEEFSQILKIPFKGQASFIEIWSLDHLLVSVPSRGLYKTKPPSPRVIKTLIQVPRQGQETHTKNKKTIVVGENEILTREIQTHMKSWVDVIRENAICLGGHKDHVFACLCHMLYCIETSTPRNLEFLLLKIMEKTRFKPNDLLPYGMLLTRLFKHVVSVSLELAFDHYLSHDRAMHLLPPYYEQKTRADQGKKRSHESNASSSSSTLNHPSLSHPLDDSIDENDVSRVHQNPCYESHYLYTFFSKTINLQTQQRDAHQEGLRSVGQALKNMMGGKRK